VQILQTGFKVEALVDIALGRGQNRAIA
jgi:hypothetical protein